jgi:nucleoside phosphorylase
LIGIIYATHFEARPFLDLTRAELIREKPFKIFTTSRPGPIPVIISGIGKVSGALACQLLLIEYGVHHVLNAGSCGALHDRADLATGSLVRIAVAVEGDHCLFDKPPTPVTGAGRIAPFLPAVRLVTSDKPVFDPEARRIFGALGDVVDMEGGAIARTATLHGKPWDMVKGVSDAAGIMDPDTLRGNIRAVSETLARVVLNELINPQP